MKIVIIGAGGRLGSALIRAYRERFEVIGFNHAQLDLANDKQIVDAIAPLGFDVLINSAALTNVDYCETHRQEAFLINAEAPRVLAEICRKKNAKLVQISTDYVFDGEKREPYREKDEARPISLYGESKLEGEKNVLAGHDRHLVVRVSWVFGPDRPSFIDAMIKRARESERVEAIADKVSTPTYTNDIALWLGEAINEIAGAAASSPGMRLSTNRYSGILHLANSGECSWQEYAQHALDCCDAAGIPLKAKTVGALKMADMKNWGARRPVYSVLSPAKYAQLTGVSPRPWQDAVADYVRKFVSR